MDIKLITRQSWGIKGKRKLDILERFGDIK